MSSEKNLFLLSSLKLKLQAISSELSNLTIRDLDELKWMQKQIIISKLFHSSKFLNCFATELDDIDLERQSRLCEIKQQRLSENDLKLKKREVESMFRTSYMRVFLKGLEKQRWPPSLEAFSDPLSEIMESNSKFLQALDFLLTIELPNVHPASPAKVPDGEPKPQSFRNASENIVPRFSDQVVQEKVINSPKAPVSHVKISPELTENTDKAPFNITAMQRLEYQNKILVDRLRSLEGANKRREALESSIYSVLLDFQDFIKSQEASNNANICPHCSQGFTGASEKGIKSNTSLKKWDIKLEQLKAKWNEATNLSNKNFDSNNSFDEIQNYVNPVLNSSKNCEYDDNLRQDLYKLTSIMSKIGGEVQENCSTNSPVYLKKIFNDVKMQKDIILLSSSILNRLSLFGGLNEADLPTSSGLFALMDKIHSLNLSKSVCLQIDELLTGSLTEYVQLQKSFQLVTLFSSELINFVESILKNYKVFYLQRQENFLSELKLEMVAESSNTKQKNDHPKHFIKILKLIFQSLQSIESNTRISNPLGQDGSLVNPLDILSRGVLGKDVANLINAVRLAGTDFPEVENILKENYDKHLAIFNREIEEYNSIIANLLQLKHKNDAIQQFQSRSKSQSSPRPSPSATEKTRPRHSAQSKEKRKSIDNRPPFNLGGGLG